MAEQAKILPISAVESSRKPLPAPPPKLAERILVFLAGLVVLAVFGGLAGLIVATTRTVSLVRVLAVALAGFFAFFGLNLVWQMVLGRSREAGPFYRFLAWLGRFSPAWLMFGVPCVALLCVLLGAATGQRFELSAGLWLLAAWAITYFGVLVHELGHLAAGIGNGVAVRKVVVGAVEARLEEGRWRLGLGRDWRMLLGGMVHGTLEKSPGWAIRWYRFIAGGPIATMLLLGGLLWLNPFPLRDLVDPHGALQSLFTLSIGSTASTLVSCLVPLQHTPLGVANDGFMLWQLAPKVLRGE